jgi:hypothetical protein
LLSTQKSWQDAFLYHEANFVVNHCAAWLALSDLAVYEEAIQLLQKYPAPFDGGGGSA